MKITRIASALVFLSLIAAHDVLAQRRSSGGSSSGGRNTPSSSGGGSSSGGSSSGGTKQAPSSGGNTASNGGRRGGDSGSQPRASSGNGSSGTTNGRTSGNSSSGGKIGKIRDSADRAASRRRVYTGRGVWIGNCWNCDYWGWYGPRWGWYSGGYWYPERHRRHHHDGDGAEEAPGQGYDEYPYADADDNDSTHAFVKQHVTQRRSYGAVTGQYFSDVGSTTRMGHVGLEGARGLLRGELDYSYSAEPVQGVTNRLHDFRIAGGIQPRLGDHAYMTATLGLRALGIPGGRSAGGIEGGLGLQLLPVKPFGVNITGRAAAMSWNGGTDYFTLKELNTTGSIFVNRVELQAGWHWEKIGSDPAFGGPIAGLRVWF